MSRPLKNLYKCSVMSDDCTTITKVASLMLLRCKTKLATNVIKSNNIYNFTVIGVGRNTKNKLHSISKLYGCIFLSEKLK